MLRLAIIGCGWAGERHFLAATEFPEEVEVIAIVDSDEEFLLYSLNEDGRDDGGVGGMPFEYDIPWRSQR